MFLCKSYPGNAIIFKDIEDAKTAILQNINKDGIKPNGKQVSLVGIVAQIKSKGHILELEYVMH